MYATACAISVASSNKIKCTFRWLLRVRVSHILNMNNSLTLQVQLYKKAHKRYQLDLIFGQDYFQESKMPFEVGPMKACRGTYLLHRVFLPFHAEVDWFRHLLHWHTWYIQRIRQKLNENRWQQINRRVQHTTYSTTRLLDCRILGYRQNRPVMLWDVHHQQHIVKWTEPIRSVAEGRSHMEIPQQMQGLVDGTEYPLTSSASAPLFKWDLAKARGGGRIGPPTCRPNTAVLNDKHHCMIYPREAKNRPISGWNCSQEPNLLLRGDPGAWRAISSVDGCDMSIMRAIEQDDSDCKFAMSIHHSCICP